jgi:hypothetical protein
VFFGVELEMCNASGDDAAAYVEDCLAPFAQAHSSEFMFCKEDGSVDSGIEFVSHCFTWDWLKENGELFKQFFAQTQDVNFIGDHDSAGMHIHISRGKLRYTRLLSLLRFVYGNPFFIEKISRRQMGDESAMAEYASLYQEASQKRLIVKSKHNDGYCSERYTAVNVENKATVELRFFRGVDDWDMFMRNMEFADSLYQFALSGSYNRMWPHTFGAFVRKRSNRYPRLHSLLETVIGKDQS